MLVTAGATRERLDPVRYLTNDSSGKMGFALAEAARDRGAEVTVVKEARPRPSRRDSDCSGGEHGGSARCHEKEATEQDIVIQAAAPADYRPETVSGIKIKKKKGEEMILRLVETPDVARAVGGLKRTGQTLVGFAAETDHLKEHAAGKAGPERTWT